MVNWFAFNAHVLTIIIRWTSGCGALLRLLGRIPRTCYMKEQSLEKSFVNWKWIYMYTCMCNEKPDITRSFLGSKGHRYNQVLL